MLSFYSSDYSRAVPLSKRLAAAALGLLLLCFGTALAAQAQPANRVVIPRASQVAFGAVGVHTHANYLLFDTGSLNLSALQHDPVHYPNLIVKAHSSLPTDRAALPPELAAFAAGGPPLENPYGSIDGGHGKPGWDIHPEQHNGKNQARVVAPTRFANWLAAQPPARRKLYAMPRHYTLEISWGMGTPLK